VGVRCSALARTSLIFAPDFLSSCTGRCHGNDTTLPFPQDATTPPVRVLSTTACFPAQLPLRDRPMARGKDVLEAIDKSETLRRKSSLERWMRDNHDAFADRLHARIADWSVLATMFADADLTDRYGNPPKPETARKTWQRVRHQVKAARARQSARSPATRSETAPPPVRATSKKPTTPASGDADIRAMLGTGRKMPEPLSE
jgi:hypothetical protein